MFEGGRNGSECEFTSSDGFKFRLDRCKMREFDEAECARMRDDFIRKHSAISLGDAELQESLGIGLSEPHEPVRILQVGGSSDDGMAGAHQVDQSVREIAQPGRTRIELPVMPRVGADGTVQAPPPPDFNSATASASSSGAR